MYVSWRQPRWLGNLAAACLSLAVSPPFLAAAPTAQPPLATPPAPSASPGPKQASPAAQLIYRGTYHRRGTAAGAPRLFWYERWHEAVGGRWRSTHVHHQLDGRVVLRQSVLHSARYELLQFESEHRQTGVLAQARVLGPGRVRLQRTTPSGQGGEADVEVVELTHDNPLVVGPTLYGMMLRHWGRLVAGQRVAVDYLSIERLETYTFELRRVASDGPAMTFELAPSGFLLGLLVSPLRIRFSESRQVLSYEGPSPVSLERDGELESFDARIEYSERAIPFR